MNCPPLAEGKAHNPNKSSGATLSDIKTENGCQDFNLIAALWGKKCLHDMEVSTLNLSKALSLQLLDPEVSHPFK